MRGTWASRMHEHGKQPKDSSVNEKYLRLPWALTGQSPQDLGLQGFVHIQWQWGELWGESGWKRPEFDIACPSALSRARIGRLSRGKGGSVDELGGEETDEAVANASEWCVGVADRVRGSLAGQAGWKAEKG